MPFETPYKPDPLFIYSKKVNRFVCSMFMALVASLASMTQLMLISLAPVHDQVSKTHYL